jgi:hypothetical protein
MTLDALQEQLAEFTAEFPIRQHKKLLVAEYLSEMSAAEALERLEHDASTYCVSVVMWCSRRPRCIRPITVAIFPTPVATKRRP